MIASSLVLIANVGGVGRTVLEQLRAQDVPVRAMVRRDDDRAAELRALGAEVVIGDLTRPESVAAALKGVGRMYFAMPVSPDHLLATTVVATVAREHGKLDGLVGMSQMTVSQMTATSTSESHQQRLHWLAEQVLNWSGLPVIHIRPTSFLDNPLFTTLAARSIQANGTIALPFGAGRTSPVAVDDVARVVATVLHNPAPHGRHDGVGRRVLSGAGASGFLCGRAAGPVAGRGPREGGPAAAHRTAHRHHGPSSPREPLRPRVRRRRTRDGRTCSNDRGVRGRAQGLLPGLSRSGRGRQPQKRRSWVISVAPSALIGRIGPSPA